MGEDARQVIDGRKVGGIEAVDVADTSTQASHPLADGLVQPTPGADDNEVRPVPQHSPGLEERGQILARLDGAHKQDEALRQVESRASSREVLTAHRSEQLGHPVWHDFDP